MTNPNIERDKVEEIRGRAEKATPGPWIRSGVRHKLSVAEDCIWVGPDGYLIVALPVGKPNQHAGALKDGDFIAHAREDIPYLLSLLTVSEKRAETAEQLAEDWQCEYDKVIDERDTARSSLMRVDEKLKLIENECENSLAGRLAAHYFLANIHAMVRSALQASGDGAT